MRNIFKGFNKKKRRHNNTQEQHNPAPHERHGTTSDKISVVVNSILAILTLLAIWISYQSNQTAIKSLEYAKSKDSSDNIAQQVRDSIYSIERVVNRKYVDSTLYISQQSVGAAKKSSDIAAQAFNETKKSYEFSREAAIKELRAYIVGERFEISNISPDSFYTIEAVFKNAGKTTAYTFKHSGATVVGRSEISENVPLLVVGVTKKIDTVSITRSLGAGQSTSAIVNSYRMTAIEYDLIKSGYYQIYVAFSLSYNDIFNIPRYTHIFFRYDFKAKRFVGCKTFNDTN